MRAVLQRVNHAKVEVDGRTVGAIGRGWLVLLGVASTDGEREASYLAEKTLHLRVFPDDEGKFNRSLVDIGGEILVVSQFTLYGDCRKGRRPSFQDAAPPDHADRLYQAYVATLRESGLTVQTGQFQAHMKVSLENDGPVTMLLDSERTF